MKTQRVLPQLVVFFTLLATLTTAGCKKEENVKTEVVMTIEPNGVKVGPWFSSSPASLVPGFKGHINGKGDNTRYFSLHQIEGFTFEEGYVQVIRLEITKLVPAPADSIDESYRLISIVSKTKAQ